jgi:cell division septal protein FtsQ
MNSRRQRIFWVFLVSGLSAFALAMGYRWFERGGAFDLDTVRIRGIREADSAVVCDAVKPLFGKSIWRIDLDDLQNRLTEVPGIDSAEVSREPLNTLILNVEISQASFVIDDGNDRIPVSTGGELLPMRFLDDSLPVIKATSPIGDAAAQNLAEWFSGQGRGPDSLQYRFGEEGVLVILDDYRRVLLGMTDLSERWRDFVALENSMLYSSEYCEIDMRYAGQAVLRTSMAGYQQEDVQ